MKKSVLLAAYNGEKYIGEQIDSILCQLESGDELIISDDNPSGDTKSVVMPYVQNDARVKYIEGPGKGVIKNFEHLLSVSNGDVIFLSDQDDVWLPGKVGAVMQKMTFDKPALVMHDAYITDALLNKTEKTFFEEHGVKRGYFNNILRNSFIGCCMAFNRQLKEICIPFPDKIPMHDQWIGLKAERHGRVEFIDEPLILYRRHENTVTGGRTSFMQKIIWRAELLKNI